MIEEDEILKDALLVVILILGFVLLIGVVCVGVAWLF